MSDQQPHNSSFASQLSVLSEARLSPQTTEGNGAPGAASPAAAPFGPHGLSNGWTIPAKSNDQRGVETPDLSSFPAPPALSGGTQRLTGDGTPDEVQIRGQIFTNDPTDAISDAMMGHCNPLSNSVMATSQPNIMEKTFSFPKYVSPAAYDINEETINVVIALATLDKRDLVQGESPTNCNTKCHMTSGEALQTFFETIEGPAPSSPYSSSFLDSDGFSSMSSTDPLPYPCTPDSPRTSEEGTDEEKGR
jgi:hypothetical protein